MNFGFIRSSGNIVIRIVDPGASDIFYITNEKGLWVFDLWSTIQPQEHVDYDSPSHKLKIIGVDLI